MLNRIVPQTCSKSLRIHAGKRFKKTVKPRDSMPKEIVFAIRNYFTKFAARSNELPIFIISFLGSTII